MTRRLVDILVSALGLITLSPGLLVIAVATVLDSGFPVLFRQERVGRRGDLFVIYKFRSMTPGVSGRVDLVTVGGDPRVTRVGGWLRSTKLDELPQLWNVLRGDLSLVGPRPEVPQYVGLWPEEDRDVILSIRPGITDPASAKYRREEELLGAQSDPEHFYRTVVLPDKVKIYRDYAEHRSPAVDCRLLLDTAKQVVFR